MISISFYTLGCRSNQSETAVLQNIFEQQGYRVVDFHKSADIVVVNTCTVTQNCDAETRKLVHRIIRINPKAQIALIGCQAQLQKEQLAKLPNVRWVIGTARKMDLISVFQETHSAQTPQVITPTIPREFFSVPVPGIDRQHTRANIKIQDGCDFFCSFCEIPYARGRARSRKFDDIRREAQALVSAKHQELVLTGTNIGCYAENGKNIVDVIRALEQISGLERIRISSIEMTTIPEGLLDLMARRSKLCRYLHIPLQSGHNACLKAMKRPYTVEEFDRFIQKAVTLVPEICLGTDVMVGFPGETEEYFKETHDYLRRSSLNYFHVFSYSQRTMAKSKDLEAKVNPKTIRQRSQVLRNLSLQKRRAYYQSLIGSDAAVLFEQKKGDEWKGLTDNFVHVTARSEKDLSNRFQKVRLCGLKGQEVIGQII